MGRRSQSTASKYGEMSKSRKTKRKAALRPPVFPISTSSANSDSESTVPAVVAPKMPSMTARYVRRGQQAVETLSTDYSYVAKDIRQIAFTAVAMFALIAILYLVLQ